MRRAAKSGPAVAPEPKPKRISYIYDGFKQFFCESRHHARALLTGVPEELEEVEEDCGE